MPEDRPRVVVENRASAGVLVWMAKLYAFAALVGGALMALTTVCVYHEVAKSVPPLPDFRQYAKIAPAVSRIYAADGTVMGEFASEWRTLTPYDRIPPRMVDAVLAIEDHDYWNHGGIYLKGIVRAVWANLTAVDFAQGGSTITQQVAKKSLGAQKSIWRKLTEAILARRLERQYSKKAILAVYLNDTSFGAHEFGVAAAAQRFFGKKLDQLTLAETALIAGLPQAPSAYSPYKHPDKALARRNMVLDAMARYGSATDAEVAAAKKEPLQLHPYKDIFPDVAPWYADRVRQYVIQKYGEPRLMSGGLRIETAEEPSFDAAAYENVDYGTHKQDKRQGWRGPEWHLEGPARDLFVARQKQLYGDGALTPGRRYLAVVDKVTSDDAKVIVGARTLDLPLRNLTWAAPWSANDAENDHEVSSVKSVVKPGDVIWVQREIRSHGKFREWNLPDGHNPAWLATNDDHAWDDEHADTVVLDQVPHPEGALFTADHRTGYVAAMVGGYDYGRSVFNRAYQACRQPGSTYKPIYYSLALEQGYGYDSLYSDRAVAQVDPVTGQSWMPSDYGGTDDIDVTLEYALVYSKNQPSVEIFHDVGAQNVKAWAHTLGFSTEIIADQALALGASCTLMPELARAFATFARNGKAVGDWVYVRRVLDRDGNVVEDNSVYYDPELPATDRIDRLAATAGRRPAQAISARTAYLTSKLLRTVIQFGFSGVVRATEIPAAGKTGTSSATMDTHFVAYSSHFITAVWLGDDLRQRPLGRKDAAFMVVEPLWARYMYEVSRGYPNTEIPWEVPDGVRASNRGGTKGRHGEPMDLVYRKPEKPGDDDNPGGAAPAPDNGGA